MSSDVNDLTQTALLLRSLLPEELIRDHLEEASVAPEDLDRLLDSSGGGGGGGGDMAIKSRALRWLRCVMWASK